MECFSSSHNLGATRAQSCTAHCPPDLVADGVDVIQFTDYQRLKLFEESGLPSNASTERLEIDQLGAFRAHAVHPPGRQRRVDQFQKLTVRYRRLHAIVSHSSLDRTNVEVNAGPTEYGALLEL